MTPLCTAWASRHEPRGYDRGFEPTRECNARIIPYSYGSNDIGLHAEGGKRHPWHWSLPESPLERTHGSQPSLVREWCFFPLDNEGRAAPFTVHALRGGRSSSGQGWGVWIFPSISCFETGRVMPGSPRGTLQIPSRLLATQPCRSRREAPVCWGSRQ